MTHEEFLRINLAICEKKRQAKEHIKSNPIENAPKLSRKQVLVVDKVKSLPCLKIREVAKIANDRGIDIGQNRLFDKMRSWGMIIPHTTEPYQRAVEQGYLMVFSKVVSTYYGDRVVTWTKVTPKGTAYILEKLRKEHTY